MSTDENDRRHASRFAARIRVRFRSVEELVTAYTEDVSRGGLFVKATRQLEKGTLVQLALEIPDGKPAELVPATVAYALDGDSAKAHGRSPGMGMEFREEDVATLASRIASLLETNMDGAAGDPERPIHALIVEDSASVRAQLIRALESAGHRVTTAANGLEALGKAIREPPDAVLSDVNMPVMDGWQLLRLLKGRDVTKSVPVVFLTALDSEQDRLRGYELGVDDYVPKPFVADELVARVMRVVARRRREGRSNRTEMGMSGDLRQVSVSSLLSFLEAERRTGSLTLHGAEGPAWIGLRDGAVSSVRLFKDAPDSLFERLLLTLGWAEGRFEFEVTDVDESAEAVGVQRALLEHARRVDEANR